MSINECRYAVQWKFIRVFFIANTWESFYEVVSDTFFYIMWSELLFNAHLQMAMLQVYLCHDLLFIFHYAYIWHDALIRKSSNEQH